MPDSAASTSSSAVPAPAPTRSGLGHVIAAGFLGWTLDAFDFFVVVFLIGTLAARFHVSKAQIIGTIAVTLAFRPLGAVLFGIVADRYGRRVPLMINVVFFSVVEMLCGFAPNFATFALLRALYGIGMGGEWGVGASLVMEVAPQRWRGVLSGVLQSGYSIGYLLAALAARLILPHWGWQWMFWLGAVPALLALYIRTRVPESLAWEQKHLTSIRAISSSVFRFWKPFLYMVLLMTLMMFLSHGTQDLYPDFLASAHGLRAATVAEVAMLYNIGAVFGAIVFGWISERLGRRVGMVLAMALSLLVIPLWAFGASVALLALGAFLMQVGVQGAWGIIPAHLNELSPGTVRGLLPGLTYQLGILIAAPTAKMEYHLSTIFGYRWAMAGFEILALLLAAVVVLAGPERRGASFLEP